MMQSIKNLIAFGLLFATGAVSLAAADFNPLPPTAAKPQLAGKKTTPTTLTGRIVFIDKSLHAMAVDVKGKLLQINLVPRLRINKGGKIASIEGLAAGQEVTIVFRETPDGRLDVVSLTVDGSPTQAEAAKNIKPSQQPARDRDRDGDRFPGNINPANAGGQVHSPNH